MSLSFVQPEWLWLLLLIPFTAGLALLGRRRTTGRFWVSLGLRVVLLTMIVAALAGLQIRRHADTLSAVFVLDVSGSMEGQKVDQAKDALLYALEHLNPFAVVGDDSLYTGLDPADFSEDYLKDRASLLEDKLIRALNDFPDDGLGSEFDGQGPYAGQFIHFLYDATAYDTHKYGSVPEDAEITIRFGRDDADNPDPLIGTSGKDRLYGRAGDDTLQGGARDDYLEGGKGTDTYVYNSGDGFDTIFDSDGQILFNGITLTGGTQTAVGANTWYDDINNVRYTLDTIEAICVALETYRGHFR